MLREEDEIRSAEGIAAKYVKLKMAVVGVVARRDGMWLTERVMTLSPRAAYSGPSERHVQSSATDETVP